MVRFICQLVIVSTLFACPGCASMLRIDGPYEGKVVDAETKQPIEGAVVHGSWSRLHATPGGAVGVFYDSYEVLTDKNGEFSIPGKGLLVFSHIDEMSLSIFKVGYKQWTPNGWSGLKGKWPNDEVIWEGNKGTFKLKGMTLEERRRRVLSGPDGPAKKRRLWIIESNKEMAEIGMPASTYLPVE